MSKRLQIVLDDKEFAEIQQFAAAQQTTVSEWARRALRSARRLQPVYDLESKLQVVREASRHAYPSGSIDDMLGEIARGGGTELDP